MELSQGDKQAASLLEKAQRLIRQAEATPLESTGWMERVTQRVKWSDSMTMIKQILSQSLTYSCS